MAGWCVVCGAAAAAAAVHAAVCHISHMAVWLRALCGCFYFFLFTADLDVSDIKLLTSNTSDRIQTKEELWPL